VYTVIAAQSIANIVKSSLGPLGLDKMLVDNIGVSSSRHLSSTADIIPNIVTRSPGSHHLQ
jgi:chaperonin GroEL (HSP60 family)